MTTQASPRYAGAAWSSAVDSKEPTARARLLVSWPRGAQAVKGRLRPGTTPWRFSVEPDGVRFILERHRDDENPSLFFQPTDAWLELEDPRAESAELLKKLAVAINTQGQAPLLELNPAAHRMPSWIRRIHLVNARVIAGRVLDLTDGEGGACHLVLTGPNGSGKTVILDALSKDLSSNRRNEYLEKLDQKRAAEMVLAASDDELVSWITEYFENGDPPQDLYESARNEGVWERYPNAFGEVYTAITQLASFRKLTERDFGEVCVAPEMLAQFDPNDMVLVQCGAQPLAAMKQPGASIGRSWLDGSSRKVDQSDFLTTLIAVQAERAFAREAGNDERANELQTWLLTVEAAFAELAGANRAGGIALRLEFVPAKLTYQIVDSRIGPVPPERLPSGLRRVLNMWARILLAVEGWSRTCGRPREDAMGWVIVDEPEAHLHAELQERLMPFLVAAFPNLQFIVATHSPEVVASVENAVVYDLREPIQRFEPGRYYATKYDRMLTRHFGLAAPYSVRAERDLRELAGLFELDDLSSEQRQRMSELAERFRDEPNILAYRVWERLHARSLDVERSE